MELSNFKGTIYGKLKNNLFVWDSAWGSFRPINRIGWDGKQIRFAENFTEDIFSPNYGYGSDVMKELCRKLTETTEIDIPESETISWLDGEWWNDRKCQFLYECTPRDFSSWKRYLKYMNSSHRTLRTFHKNRVTKRLLPK